MKLLETERVSWRHLLDRWYQLIIVCAQNNHDFEIEEVQKAWIYSIVTGDTRDLTLDGGLFQSAKIEFNPSELLRLWNSVFRLQPTTQDNISTFMREAHTRTAF